RRDANRLPCLHADQEPAAHRSDLHRDLLSVGRPPQLDANRPKNVGNVMSRPSATSTPATQAVTRTLTSRPRHARPRIAHATNQPATASVVLPDSGPTRAVNVSHSFTPAEASASVVRA